MVYKWLMLELERGAAELIKAVGSLCILFSFGLIFGVQACGVITPAFFFSFM